MKDPRAFLATVAGISLLLGLVSANTLLIVVAIAASAAMLWLGTR